MAKRYVEMNPRIELPGQPPIDITGPTPGEQAILSQLSQLTVGLNTLVGQIDMLIRIECGNVQKKEVNERIKANDERVKAEILAAQGTDAVPVVQKGNTNIGGDSA